MGQPVAEFTRRAVEAVVLDPLPGYPALAALHGIQQPLHGSGVEGVGGDTVNGLGGESNHFALSQRLHRPVNDVALVVRRADIEYDRRHIAYNNEPN